MLKRCALLLIAVLAGAVQGSPLQKQWRAENDAASMEYCPEDGFYAKDTTSCISEFHVCVDNVIYSLFCPANSVFDPETSRCTNPEKSSCYETTAAPTSAPFTCPPVDGLYPMNDECQSSYYFCIGGTPYLQTCPGASVFDPLTSQCSASCTEPTTTTTTEAATTSAPFACPPVDGLYPMNDECQSSYYFCIGGTPYLQTCPGTSVFDPLTSQCSASCTEPTTTTTTEAPTTSAPFDCPPVDGLYPMNDQCQSSYYFCIGGTPYLQTCPGASVFDPLTLQCSASCSEPTTTTTTEAPTTPTQAPTPAPFTCPPVDGLYPMNEQCQSSYYLCIGGTPYLQTCPGTAVFDPITSQCSSSCSSPTTTTLATTTSAPFTCPPVDGTYPMNEECQSSYYFCIGGTPYLQTCPGTSVFDPITLQCSASCSEPTTTTTTLAPTTPSTEAPTTSAPFTCPPVDGLYPMNDQCQSSYYFCIGGTPYLQTCPGTSVFDPISLQCSASCSEPTTTTTTQAPTTPTTEAPTTSAPFTCPPIDGLYPMNDQCQSSYYFCIGGTPYLQTCPGASVFDPLTLQCSASCSEPTTTTTTEAPTTPTQAPTPAPFTCPPVDGLYPINEECQSNYYFCIGGVGYPQRCPETAVFNPITLQCSSSCSEPTTTTTTTTTSTTTTTEAPSTSAPFTCPAPDGVFPVNEQCQSTYYFCIGGTPYQQTCPGTSVFDPSTMQCAASCSEPTTTTTMAPFTCPAPDGIFAASDQCQPTYYFCVGGTPYLQTCPDSSVFNPTTSQCSASCTAPTTPTTTPSTTAAATTTTSTTTTAAPGGPFECPESTGTFANPVDCKSYYVCSNGNPSLFVCVSGLVYNPEIFQCDWPYNVPECEFAYGNNDEAGI